VNVSLTPGAGLFESPRTHHATGALVISGKSLKLLGNFLSAALSAFPPCYHGPRTKLPGICVTDEKQFCGLPQIAPAPAAVSAGKPARRCTRAGLLGNRQDISRRIPDRRREVKRHIKDEPGALRHGVKVGRASLLTFSGIAAPPGGSAFCYPRASTGTFSCLSKTSFFRSPPQGHISPCVGSCFVAIRFVQAPRPKPERIAPQAETGELPAMCIRLIAALWSRSWCTPQLLQVHSRLESVRLVWM
jgi:hypothetical protein